MRQIIVIVLLFSSAYASAQETLLADSTYAIIYHSSGYPIPIRKKPSVDSKQIAQFQSIDSVLVVEYTGGKYCEVMLPGSKDETGYLYVDFLIYDEHAVEKINDYNKRKGGTVRLSYTKPPKGYKSQQTKEIPNSTYRTTPSSSRVIHTGPRGGQYYINKNGNKTYVKD